MDILSLSEYADRYAGGPGAIYIGDLGQLAGPAVTDEFMPGYGTVLGDDNGQVPLYALEQNQWIYETDYYRSLHEKARLTNPTQLVEREERISLQHTCINRLLLQCQLLEAYFVPNVAARTNRQIHINVSSFPELGIAGPDTAYLIAGGTLDMVEIYGGFVGTEFPGLSLQYLWGLWPDHQTHFAMQTDIAPELDWVITEEMGAQVLMRNWIASDDQYIYGDQRLNSPADFRGLRTRSHSTELSDWLDGMGADSQFVAFAEVYTAMERGILDAAVTGANPALGQRWYEVSEYMNGPLTSFNSTIIAINDQVWESIPGDLQQILLEEGAKFELEALRLAAIQNITPLQRNIEAGMEFVEFNPEIRKWSFESAVDGVIPGWLGRLRISQIRPRNSGDFQRTRRPLRRPVYRREWLGGQDRHHRRSPRRQDHGAGAVGVAPRNRHLLSSPPVPGPGCVRTSRSSAPWPYLADEVRLQVLLQTCNASLGSPTWTAARR